MKAPPRRFQVLDAMVLVGSAALAASLTLLYRKYDGPERRLEFLTRLSRSERIWVYVEAFTSLVSLWLLALSFGLLIIRWRRPRPKLARMMAQAGTVCVVVVAVVFLADLLPALVVILATQRAPAEFLYITTLKYSTQHVGPAVAAAWVVLALGGRLRCERSWIDRFGRLLGICWVAPYLLLQFGHCIQVEDVVSHPPPVAPLLPVSLFSDSESPFDPPDSSPAPASSATGSIPGLPDDEMPSELPDGLPPSRPSSGKSHLPSRAIPVVPSRGVEEGV
jgi:hypothetical protein